MRVRSRGSALVAVVPGGGTQGSSRWANRWTICPYRSGARERGRGPSKSHPDALGVLSYLPDGEGRLSLLQEGMRNSCVSRTGTRRASVSGLRPSEFILTGTPEGAGVDRKSLVLLKDGQELTTI